MIDVPLNFLRFLTSPSTESWKVYWDSWINELVSNPAHVFIETVLILFVLYILVVQRSYNPRIPVEVLTKAEEEKLIEEWVPEPMVNPLFNEKDAIDRQAISDVVVTKELKNSFEIETAHWGILRDFVSQDFYGMNRNQRVEKVLRDTLDKYGVGSCGPRGFYGTIDTHLHLEKALAKFSGCEEAIIFSDNTSTIASVIPAFAKRGDLLVVDNGVCSAVYTGCKLSRARIILYEHNDVSDLRRKLEKIEVEDKKTGISSAKQRRFIVTEGISRNFGTLLNLPDVLKLKKEFGFRLIVDETISFGVLGKTGRGVTEHFGLPVTCVDLLTGSCETSLASVGGFCVGSKAVVSHQRLAAAGYVFSASAPAYTSTIAQEALNMIDESNGDLPGELMDRISAFHKYFKKTMKKKSLFEINSDVHSPVIHLCVKGGSDRKKKHEFLCTLRTYLLENGFFTTVVVLNASSIVKVPEPTLKISIRLTQPSTFQTRLILRIKEFEDKF